MDNTKGCPSTPPTIYYLKPFTSCHTTHLSTLREHPYLPMNPMFSIGHGTAGAKVCPTGPLTSLPEFHSIPIGRAFLEWSLLPERFRGADWLEEMVSLVHVHWRVR